MNYYVVGYMYCGKSTFGRRMAVERGMQFFDTDQAFEERYHYTIPRFFNTFGENVFRRLETEILHSTATLDNYVIATGGGTPCYNGNMDFILSHGVAIYLQMTVDQLAYRALNSRNPRPAMRGLKNEELHAKIATQLSERERYYLQANIVMDGTNPSF